MNGKCTYLLGICGYSWVRGCACYRGAGPGDIRQTPDPPLTNPDLPHSTCSPDNTYVNAFNAYNGYFYTKYKNIKGLAKSSDKYHVGIHWKGLTEYYQMSTHVPGFSHFLGFLHHFVLANLATTSIIKG